MPMTNSSPIAWFRSNELKINVILEYLLHKQYIDNQLIALIFYMYNR